MKKCNVCGVAISGAFNKRYCSKKCQNRFHAARRRKYYMDRHDKYYTYFKNYRIKHKERDAYKIKTRTNKANAILKQKIFDRYGWKCKCCGESNIKFLTMDHVNNDGWKERLTIGYRIGGPTLYREIVKRGFPDTFQTLCFNCNCGKRVNNGICPHKSYK